jgi:hypothetical protein
MGETEIRAVVRQALTAAGDAEGARLADKDSSLMTELRAPDLPGWRFFRFVSTPHPHAGFHVAVGEGMVLDLTDRPADFVHVLRGTDVVLQDARQAAQVARLYVETTRPMTDFVKVIEGVDDIALRTGLPAAERRARERSLAKLRQVVRPASAVRRGEGFEATVFTQAAEKIERRTITITGDGSLSQQTRVIAAV